MQNCLMRELMLRWLTLCLSAVNDDAKILSLYSHLQDFSKINENIFLLTANLLYKKRSNTNVEPLTHH